MDAEESLESLQLRVSLRAEINREPSDRERLEAQHGPVWDTTELRRDFEVLEFSAPLIVARRRSDQALGSLYFQENPRFYFGWKTYEEESR